MTVRRTATTRSLTAEKMSALLAAPPPALPLPPIPAKARLSVGTITLGCDPEFFFEQDGKVIGSEKVLGKKGVTGEYGVKEAFIMDGVQVELNPSPGTCREGVAQNMAAAFRALKLHLSKLGSVKATFTTCINLDKKELDSLSDAAKLLGCAPSLNRADKKAAVTIDGSKALRRSAGGHIHLGLAGYNYTPEANFMKAGIRERVVDILDILVGNTCVLIDRDPNAAARRRIYGRAGEYRLPKHGLEYRTLSNFWLRNYVLMSFVMGIARNAVSVVNTTLMQNYYRKQSEVGPPGPHYAKDYYSMQYTPHVWDAEAVLLAMIGGEEGMKRVRLAINTNNWDLAKQNFDRIKPFIQAYFPQGTTGFAADMLDNFETFVTTVKEKGIEAYFPDDPLEHWSELRVGGNGWENWIRNRCGKKPFSGAGLAAIQALGKKKAVPVKKAAPRKIAQTRSASQSASL